MEIAAFQLKDIPKIAENLISEFDKHRVFIFRAPMGAGKTTLIKEICHQLGTHDVVASPTFAIVNVYESASKEDIYHFDFYRLEKVQDAFEIGFYDYLDSGSYCFIEWPDLILEYLPDAYVEVRISEGKDENTRQLKAELVFVE